MGPRAGGFGPPATAPPSQPRGRGLSPARDPQVCRGAMWGGERGEAAGPTSPSLSHSPLAGNQVPTRRATSSPGLAWGGTPARGPPQGHAGGPGMPFGGGMPVFANACVPLPAWHVFSWSCSPAACCSSPSPATAHPQPCTPGCPQHPLCPCSCVPPPPPPQHPPSTSARHSTRSPSPPWGARRGASSPLPAWPSYEEVQGPAGLTPCRWAPCHPPPPPFRRQRLFPTAPGWFGGGGGGLRSACRRVEGFALPLCARTRVHTWERMCVCARVCIPAGAA